LKSATLFVGASKVEDLATSHGTGFHFRRNSRDLL